MKPLIGNNDYPAIYRTSNASRSITSHGWPLCR